MTAPVPSLLVEVWPVTEVVRRLLVAVMAWFAAVPKAPDVQELVVVLQSQELVRSPAEYRFPATSPVGKPSVTSITKFCWQVYWTGLVLPERAVEK